MRPVSLAAVVLAAGSSRRLGRPKQTLTLGGETLLARAVRTAREAGLAPVVAVVPQGGIATAQLPPGTVVLVNGKAADGMSTSVHLGVRWAMQQRLPGLLLMTCDQPGVSAEHLCRLCADPARVTGSAYAGRAGVPAYFPAANFAELLQLTGDAGARQLLKDAAVIPDEALALDIDTEQDLAQAQAQYGRTAGQNGQRSWPAQNADSFRE